MAGLRVLWPDTKPSEVVMKTVENLRQKRNFTEEELRRLQLYLTSVEYNPGHMEDAVLLHKNNP